MSILFDLNLIPFVHYAGRDYPELIGLHAADPPRRTARGRAADRLIQYLNIQGNAPLAPGKQRQVLADLSKLYFETPGSVTSAMRAVAEQLNQILLERNKYIASSSRQALGQFCQIVIREDRLYLAQSGSVHTFLIKESETLEFFDPGMEDRSLGQSRKTPIMYFQASIDANDTLLVASQPAPDWSASTLIDLHGQGPESLRRRLFGQGLNDIHAVLIQARPGQGKFFLPRDKPAFRPVITTNAPEELVDEDPRIAEKSVETQEVSKQVGVNEEAEASQELVEQPLTPYPTPQLDETQAEEKEKSTSEPEGAIDSISPDAIDKPAISSTPVRSTSARSFTKTVAIIWSDLREFIKNVFRRLRCFLARILPGEELFTLPSGIMAFLAVAVPVVIVAIASVTYFSLGVDAQYELLYNKAEEAAFQAINQTDLQQKRAELEVTLRLLDQAESYRRDTPEVRTLRSEVRNILDGLDLVVRVNYQPAIVDGLPPTVSIISMVISSGDLYLLDSNSSSVLRAELKGNIYYRDPNFQCSPDTSGSSLVGPLIDITPWSSGFTPEADIIAIDASGNLLFCSDSDTPKMQSLTPSSSEKWGHITLASLDLGNFYILDLLSKNVWVYRRSYFSESPIGFSDSELSDLDDVIDMTVNRDDLYLLHVDGRLTLCVYNELADAPTRCSDIPYVDFRPGSENLPLFPPSPFAQIQYTQPPDPSLFLLEPQKQAIYHFSLRNLAFQKQYLPEEPLSTDKASAFAVDTVQRNLFLAIGNQVFHAVMP